MAQIFQILLITHSKYDKILTQGAIGIDLVLLEFPDSVREELIYGRNLAFSALSSIYAILAPGKGDCCSSAPGRCNCVIKWVIFKLMLRMNVSDIPCEIVLKWMPQNITGE